MAATVESGKDGLIKIGANTLGFITRWSFTKSAVTTRFGSSNVPGYKATVAGVKEGSGSIDYKLDVAGTVSTAPQTALLEGTAVTLLLYTNATEFFTVPAVIKSNAVMCDIDDGTATGGSATFETNGAWTEPTWS